MVMLPPVKDDLAHVPAKLLGMLDKVIQRMDETKIPKIKPLKQSLIDLCTVLQEVIKPDCDPVKLIEAFDDWASQNTEDASYKFIIEQHRQQPFPRKNALKSKLR